MWFARKLKKTRASKKNCQYNFHCCENQYNFHCCESQYNFHCCVHPSIILTAVLIKCIIQNQIMYIHTTVLKWFSSVQRSRQTIHRSDSQALRSKYAVDSWLQWVKWVKVRQPDSLGYTNIPILTQPNTATEHGHNSAGNDVPNHLSTLRGNDLVSSSHATSWIEIIYWKLTHWCKSY